MFFFSKLKNCMFIVLALLLATGANLILKSAYICRFPDMEGTRTFYLHSASSQGLRKERLSFRDLSFVKGESVRFAIEEGADIEKIAENILRKYKATLLFKEEVCGVTSYYCYTELWSDGIFINGQKINLHIAVNADTGTVGSPIIFDGF